MNARVTAVAVAGVLALGLLRDGGLVGAPAPGGEIGATPLAGACRSPAPLSLELLGEARLPRVLFFEGALVGGLSALAYDPGRGVYYALSDDRGQLGPARFYTLEIGLEDGRLLPDEIAVVGVTRLRDADGRPFAAGSIDPEGLALSSRGTLFLSSEGDADAGVAPFVREFGLDGAHRRDFALPAAYLPDGERRRGVRTNLGFEALTLTPDGGALFTAVENALVQDGPRAGLGRRSPARLLRLDPAGGGPAGEYLYLTDPVAAPPLIPGTLTVAGLVELLALDGETLLALERSYSAGVGNAVRLYRVSLAGADPLAGRDRLDLAAEPVQPVSKCLLLDLGTLGISLDNLEGMTLGPLLADGRRTLVLVSDDNFNPFQVTQVLAFALGDGAAPQK